MSRNRYVSCCTGILLIFGLSLSAQEQSITAWQTTNSAAGRTGTGQSAADIRTLAAASGIDTAQNTILARSSADYRVTPGDVYTLSYAAGTTPVSYVIIVDPSYRIRVSNLGVISGSGKTFVQLKAEAEAAVAANYPLSGVQLVLTQPAVFRVHLSGEVETAGEVSAWGLSRLSSLLAEGSLTPYASLRDVEVKSSGGQMKTYDLFKVQREGDLSQDPYLRPGDTVRFRRAGRTVIVSGAVERPGTYQLLDGENLRELSEYYGNGFTAEADRERAEVTRLVNSREASGEKLFVSWNGDGGSFVLEDRDEVVVPSAVSLRPAMFVEGAVARTAQSLDDMGQSTTSDASDLSASNRLVVRFAAGETYASLVRANTAWFTAVSDTLNAYVLRGEERITVNLNPLLYGSRNAGSLEVQENDVLVVPFRQYFVTVAGAVMNPGRYPYIPERDWSYYIALAGGFIPERNASQTVVITDAGGKALKKSDAISPETVITARTNHGLYYFNLYAPAITTVLTLVTTFFSIQAYINR